MNRKHSYSPNCGRGSEERDRSGEYGDGNENVNGNVPEENFSHDPVHAEL